MLSCWLTCWRTNPAQKLMVNAGRGASVRFAAAVCHRLPFQISASPALISIGLPSGYGGDGCSAPAMRTGHHLGGAVVGGEIAQRDQRIAQNRLMRPRQRIHLVVAVQALGDRPGNWLLVMHHESRQSRPRTPSITGSSFGCTGSAS